MKTVKVAPTSLFTCIENTMVFYADMIHEDAAKFKINKPAIEALESLIRTWATLQTTTNACDIAEKIKVLTYPDNADVEPQPLELPFDFDKHKSKVGTL